MPPDDLLSDRWLAELSRLLPELCDRYPDLPAPLGDKSVARNRLFEAVARLLQALAARTLLVVFIDDVQWADAASLDVIHYLARRFAESATPALLLLTLRMEERVPPGLAEWRTGMERSVSLTRLQPGPLTIEDTLHLLQALGGTEGKDGKHAANLERFGQWLFAETEGQPFYLMEPLKVLLERGVLASRPDDEGGWSIDFTAAMEHETVIRGFFPPSVREVICARLDRLTPNAFALLVAGAVLGQGITFEHLCQVADLAEHDGLPALDEVLHSRLLHESERERGEQLTDGRYVFAHAKIRAVVYAEAGEARRSIFHRRAVKVLQEAAAPSAVLAYHALGAGLAEPAFRWSLAAGDEAMWVVAVRDAITFYEQARHLMAERLHELDLLTMLPAPEIEHLYVHLGRAYELNAEWEKARVVYTLLLVYAQNTHQPVMESTALNRLAILAAQQSFDLAIAQTLLAAAWRIAEASGDLATRIETEWNLAQMALHAWKSKRALLHAERALEQVRMTGRKELTARGLYMLGLSSAFGGLWKEVVACAEEAHTLYAAIEDQTVDAAEVSEQLTYAGFPPSWQLTNRVMEVFCLCLLAFGHVNLGEPQTDVNVARAALDISLEINNIWVQAYSLLNLSHALLEVGEYEEALLATQKGVEMARTLPNPTLLFFLLTVSGAVHQAMMHLEEARATLMESLALIDALALRSYQVLTTSRLCANCALAGDWKSAYTYAREAGAVRNDIETSLLFLDFVRYHEIEALLRGGEREWAREDIERLGASLSTNRRHRLPYLRARATQAQWDGETRQALASLQEAANLANEIGLPGELWQVQAALGELYASCGEREQAEQAFAQALAMVQALAEKIGDEALRTNFLAKPAVRRVLERAPA